MTGRQLRAFLVTLVSFLLVAAGGALALLPAQADTSVGETKNGTGEFADLEVAVSKTRDLINEVVTVSWKGGKPSYPIERPRRDFLQIMQCWGDDTAGPSPDQCQFGALTEIQASLPHNAINSRQMGGSASAFPTDPAQALDPAWGVPGRQYLPFRSVTGDNVSGLYSGFSRFYDIQGTNEITIATTRADGSGIEFFEVQTATEAPGLGCGSPLDVDGHKVGRSCWLVVVPRSDTEVDGSHRDGENADRRLQSSPLSATNWANKISFPLGFQPLGVNCPLGSGQVTVLGSEPATEAISRWQTTLCQQTNTVFDFNQIPDTAGRSNLNGRAPGMAFLGAPLAEDPPAGAPVYAPLAVSGLGIAYNIEIREAPTTAPEELRVRVGQRIDDLKLTPRLVAKLLSQSYRSGTNNPQAVAGNPLSIEADKEFRALNPAFEHINGDNPVVRGVLSPLNPGDANALVWQWIGGDAEARDFIAGKPDPDGMVINPLWKDVALTRSDFPKIDQSCAPPTGTGAPDLCLASTDPYANDMHEGVRSAIRGDLLTRKDWDVTAIPPQYKKDKPLQKGQRAMMAVSDSATAARFRLPMVSLRNASGKFVGPTDASLAAGLAAMTPSAVPGVLVPNPNAAGDDVYPLTTVSYATTVPAGLSADSRKAYGALIRYAVGDGQTPGDQPGNLPAGYLPLTQAMKDQALASAKAIEEYAPPGTPTPQPTPQPTAKPQAPVTQSNTSTSTSASSSNSTATRSTTSGASATPTSTATTTSSPTPDAAPATGGSTPTPAPAAASPGKASPAFRPVAGVTPETPAGPGAKVFLWLLLAAALTAAGAQALPRLLPALAERSAARPSSPPVVPPASPGVHVGRGGGAGA